MADTNKGAISEEGTKLVQGYVDDFSRRIAGGDATSTFLKGFLLIENSLDHLMVLVFDTKADIKNKSFSGKVKELTENDAFGSEEPAASCLFALNEIHADLIHQYNFQLTLSQLDAVGYFLGKEYLVRRYATGADEQKLLLWVLERIVSMVYLPVWYHLNGQNPPPVAPDENSSRSPSAGTFRVNHSS